MKKLILFFIFAIIFNNVIAQKVEKDNRSILKYIYSISKVSNDTLIVPESYKNLLVKISDTDVISVTILSVVLHGNIKNISITGLLIYDAIEYKDYISANQLLNSFIQIDEIEANICIMIVALASNCKYIKYHDL